MKVLVACEFSGIVREAFKAKGHDAWSCDLLPQKITHLCLTARSIINARVLCANEKLTGSERSERSGAAIC